MSTLTQFLGGARSATSLQGFEYSSGTGPIGNGLTPLDPGSLTANVWKEVLNVASPGIFFGALIRNGDVTSRATSIRVTIDGVLVATSAMAVSAGGSNFGATVGCLVASNGASPTTVWAPFRTLVIEVRSSDTTTVPRYGALYTVTA